MNKRKGFTLIELLVVIAIIAILATVVIINVTGAKAKANDAKIMSDLNVVGKAASVHNIYYDFKLFKDFDYGGIAQFGSSGNQRMDDADIAQFKDEAGNSLITKSPKPSTPDSTNDYENDHGYSYEWISTDDIVDDVLAFSYSLSDPKKRFQCQFGKMWTDYGEKIGCRTLSS